MLKVDANHFKDKSNFTSYQAQVTGKRSYFLFSAIEHAAKLHSELQEQEWLLSELSVLQRKCLQ